MAATTLVNFRLDSNVKESMEKVCKAMGMSMTTAFTIFANKVSREKRIPFEVNADPFYSKENLDYLAKTIADYKMGKAKEVEHDLVEV